MALHYPYRERTERVIGLARIVLAALSFLTIYLDQTQPGRYQTAAYALLGAYLLYALVVGTVVWRVHRPLRGLQLGTHMVDLAMFVVIMYFTEGSTSPFYVYFVFAMVVATLRWQTRGTIVTAAASILAFLALGVLTARLLGDPEFELSRFVVRAVYLGIVAVLLTQFERFERALRGELERLANWRRTSHTDIPSLIEASLPEAVQIIGARRGLLIWDQAEEPSRFVAYSDSDGVKLTRRAPDVFGDLVSPDLVDVGFICFSRPGMVVLAKDGEIRSLEVEGIEPTLRAEFSVTDAVSVPLTGVEFKGRLFFLEHPAAVVDSLFTAEIVASELLARMGSVRVMDRLRDAAVKDQRMRTALELHDGLLQSLTAAGLELATAAREIPSEMAETRGKLGHVEKMISSGRHELRALIDEMRPGRQGLRPFNLGSRLAELQDFLLQQWGLRVTIRADEKLLALCSAATDGLAREVYFLTHEALVNAARHAHASSAELDLNRKGKSLRLVVVDDGQGFSVQGRYTLEQLETMGIEPVALSRRTRAMNGDLRVESGKNGTKIVITLPKVLP